MTPVSFDELTEKSSAEASMEVRERVIEARLIQEKRFAEVKEVHCNAQMNTRQLQKHCQLSKESQQLLKAAMEQLELSARAYDQILKVARTIADLDESKVVESEHIAEAIQYRSLDREGWAG